MNDPKHRDDVVTVVVVRTGGVAGLRRRWQVDAGDDEADRWLPLIERCPWEARGAPEDERGDAPDAEAARDATPGPDAAPAPPETPAARRSADRFVWSIRARTPDTRHERELPDTELTGPWRALVDAVRDAAAG